MLRKFEITLTLDFLFSVETSFLKLYLLVSLHSYFEWNLLAKKKKKN